MLQVDYEKEDNVCNFTLLFIIIVRNCPKTTIVAVCLAKYEL